MSVNESIDTSLSPLPRMPDSQPLGTLFQVFFYDATLEAIEPPPALAVLVCLYERPMHPYEIAHTLRSPPRSTTACVSTTWLALRRRRVTRTPRAHPKPRETTCATAPSPPGAKTTYEITDEGTRETTDWLAELLAVPQKEYPQFMAGLSFLPALPPEEVLAVLRDRAQAIEVRLLLQRGALEAANKAGLPRLYGIEAEYELAIAERRLTRSVHSPA